MTSLDMAALLRDYGLQGAVGLLLAAVMFLFSSLMASHGRERALLERVIAVAEAYKAATSVSAEALKDNERAVTSLNSAVQTLAREAEGAAKDTRHAIANLQGSVEAVVKFLDRALPREPRE